MAAVAVAFAIVVLGVFCGRLATSHYGVIAIELLLGAPILVAISRRPAVAMVVLLAVVSVRVRIRLVAPCEPPRPPAGQSPQTCCLRQRLEGPSCAGRGRAGRRRLALLRGAGTASAPGERRHDQDGAPWLHAVARRIV